MSPASRGAPPAGAGEPCSGPSGAASTDERLRARGARAVRMRLSSFFAAMAPLDDERVEECVDRVRAELPPDVELAAAVSHAQARIVSWWSRTFSVVAPNVSDVTGDPHARRAIARLPDAFLSDEPEAVGALRTLRAQLAEAVMLPAQELAPSRVRALLGVVPPLALGAAGGWLVLRGLLHAPALVALPWAALYGFLLALHGSSIIAAVLGLRQALRGGAVPARPEQAGGPLPPTAVVMPVYEEDPERVFGALAAMREALLDTGRAEAFAFYVLSDTQDPLHAADEERAWRRLAALCAGRIPVYYRRRAANLGKKAGNLAEFAVRHGRRFAYAVVLDADSLMGAATVVAAVERMEANPRLALLQAPVELRGGRTPFARALQFAHAVSGPLLFSGLSAWAGPDGNYYGHNAVVRLGAFVECCGLPTLNGPPPLGGPILSHDFVEAALLRRGGWEVRLASDLAESFEEPPATLRQYLTRDRRWCQGNLQHLGLVTSQGFTHVSRLHLLSGALAYLVSPLWLAFVGLGVALHVLGGSVDPRTQVTMTALAALVLLGPRLLGFADALARRRASFGGAARLGLSALVELAISAALAPVLMLAQTGFVLEIVLGRAVDWKPQARGAAPRGGSSDRRLVRVSLAGFLVGGALLALAPDLALATAPIWLPWTLAAAAAVPLASLRAGGVLERLGLLAVPVELAPPAIVRSAERQRDYFRADETARFRDVVLDPVLNAQRRRQLVARRLASDPALSGVADRALSRGPAAVTPGERARLLSDAAQLARLHERAWREWPVETWNVPRTVRAEPAGTDGPGSRDGPRRSRPDREP